MAGPPVAIATHGGRPAAVCGTMPIEVMRTGDPAGLLRAQLDHLRSDARLRDRAALGAALTPAEALAEAFALARWAAFLLEQLPPDERQRARDYHEPLPDDAAPILRRLSRPTARSGGAP